MVENVSACSHSINPKKKKIMKRDREDSNLMIFCDTVFLLFSFTYLFFFQGDLLEVLYIKLPAALYFDFHLLPVSLLLTLICFFIGKQVNKLLRFGSLWYPCNYLPSAFILGICTSGNRELFFIHNFGHWSTILILVLIVIGVMKVVSMIPLGRNYLMKWPYCMTLMLLTLFVTLTVGNADENLHRELKVEKLVKEGRYDDALEVGQYADETTVRLTLDRAEAMLLMPSSEPGSAIAKHIFNYPVTDADVVADSLMARTDSVMHRKDNATLTALLLKCDLSGFAEFLFADSEEHLRLSSWYPDYLPHYYVEAFVLAEYSLGINIDDVKQLYGTQYNAAKDKFDKYQEEKKSYYKYSENNRMNRLYMNYKTSYWWYYDFNN